MGVATNCKISFYTKEKKLIEKYDLEGRADGFIYGLLNDGGASFDSKKYGEFTEEQVEIMKIYFDEESMSVGEGYATVTANVQDPTELKKIWTKIRTHVIKSFNNRMKENRSNLLENISSMQKEVKDYNETKKGLFSKKNAINLPEGKPHMDDYEFDRVLFDFTWSLNSISKVMAGIEMAIKNDNLVEITVSDW